MTGLENKVAELVPASTWMDLFWDAAPVLAGIGILFLIAMRVRHQRLAQKRDKDWRARRDLRSRGA